MRQLSLSMAGQRKLFKYGFLGIAAIAIYWYFLSDGFPILWGPSASASEIAEGRELFEHEWTPNDPLAHGDGLGPVFNARSCAACHFQGGLGGGGGVEHNAVGYEVFPRAGDPTFHTGTIHNFSVNPAHKESEKLLRSLFPIVRGRRSEPGFGHCSGLAAVPDFDPVHTQSVQPTALFGAGWIDLISDRAILRNARNRGLNIAAKELTGDFDGIPAGRARHVRGGVGKFGWKAQFAHLEDFVAAACANELGLGTPLTEQAKPLTAPQSSAEPDLDRKQFRSLVAFVKTLAKPVDTGAGTRGKEIFVSVGCAVCHIPDMGGVKGVYSDFLLYNLQDPPPPGGGGGYGPSTQFERPTRPDDAPRPEEWKTPALWGVADSAPYFHDGSAATLRDAILKHRGDAKSVTEKFLALNATDQAAVISFLGTLKAPPDAIPLQNPSVTQLGRK
jgi:CxxC motif-containing protein (DUF1111 family)